MATTVHTSDANAEAADGVVVTWAAIPNGNQGDAAGGPWTGVYFYVMGTFGAGGSVQMEGSNDGTNWFILSAAARTSTGPFAPLGATEHPKFIRPNVTAGDGTTALTVVGFFAEARRAF